MNSFQQKYGVFMALLLCALAASVGTGSAAPVKKAPPHKKPSASGKPRVRPGSLPPLTPSAVVPTASVPAQADDVMIYDGQAPGKSGLAVSSWGGGSAEDNGTVSFSKGHSLQITTLGEYQGAKITFQNPVALGDTADPQRVLVLVLRLTADTRNFSARRDAVPQTEPRLILAQSQGPRLTLAQFPRGGPPRGGFIPPGGYPGPQQDNPGFSGPAPQAVPVPPQTLNAVHLTFTLVSGAQADVLRPYPDLSQTDAGAGTEQWVAISVPLAALHFAPGAASSPLQSVVIAGNDYAVFYLGQMRLTRDAAPISCFAGPSITVPAGEPVALHGTADGGLSSLKYSWDFDASDGITDEAQGRTVTTTYFKPKDYTATLTVSDIDGLKKPATSTVTIHVQ